MKILVVGANGQIGKHLVGFIQESTTLEARAMIRNEEQASFFENMDVETAIVDLEDEIDVIGKAVKGVDAIVFTAGSGSRTGFDKTLLIDLDGAVKTIEAAKQEGIDRFIMISSFDTSREEIQREEKIRPYIVAKHYADNWLRATELKYTIIHPGILTNNSGTGKVKVATELKIADVTREDIANVILACLKEDKTIGKEFQVVAGSTPIKEAIESL